MSFNTNSLAYSAFRIINRANPEELSGYNEKFDAGNTEIFQLADKKAEDIENKSGLTVALEDYTKVMNFDGSSSYVNSSDAGQGFFSKIFSKLGIDLSKNIFKTEVAENAIKEDGSFYQDDIFADCIAEHGGLQYAKEGDDLFKSAVNFAKADAKALGKALQMAYPDDERGLDSKLDVGEVRSFDSANKDFASYDMKELNFTFLDREKLNTKEVASYILAADTNKDGIITEEESLAVKEGNNADIIAKAKEIYEENK